MGEGVHSMQEEELVAKGSAFSSRGGIKALDARGGAAPVPCPRQRDLPAAAGGACVGCRPSLPPTACDNRTGPGTSPAAAAATNAHYTQLHSATLSNTLSKVGASVLGAHTHRDHPLAVTDVEHAGELILQMADRVVRLTERLLQHALQRKQLACVFYQHHLPVVGGEDG
eukprot:6255773-Pyramimonas_sp.AAC.1